MASKIIINGHEFELKAASLLRIVAAVAAFFELGASSDVTTTDATPTTVGTIAVPSSGSVMVFSFVQGIQSDGSNGFAQVSVNSARRSGAGAPALSQGATGLILAALENTFAIVRPSFGYVISGNNFLRQVTGKAATTIVWSVFYIAVVR